MLTKEATPVCQVIHQTFIAYSIAYIQTNADMSPSAVNIKNVYSIASIPADGIGPEVIEAGIEALNALSDVLQTFDLKFTHYNWSSDTYKKTGKYIPDDGLEQLKRHDAILFGAVGAPGMFRNLCKSTCTQTAMQMCPTTSPCGDFD